MIVKFEWEKAHCLKIQLGSHAPSADELESYDYAPVRTLSPCQLGVPPYIKYFFSIYLRPEPIRHRFVYYILEWED